MDEEERQQRLLEMQDNAKWREEQRQRNVKRYRDDDEKEDKGRDVNASDFIKYVISCVAFFISVFNICISV